MQVRVLPSQPKSRKEPVMASKTKSAPKPLTIKQEKFAQEYVKTGNASEAYRRSYKADNMKTEVIHVKACELLKSGNVSVRVQELKTKTAERNEITVDDLVAELEEARKLAKDTQQTSTMVSATMGKGKLLGMIVDRKDITVHSQISAMSDDELASFILEIDVDDDDYGFESPQEA
jgi:phage terminase small subunit